MEKLDLNLLWSAITSKTGQPNTTASIAILGKFGIILWHPNKIITAYLLLPPAEKNKSGMWNNSQNNLSPHSHTVGLCLFSPDYSLQSKKTGKTSQLSWCGINSNIINYGPVRTWKLKRFFYNQSYWKICLYILFYCSQNQNAIIIMGEGYL